MQTFSEQSLLNEQLNAFRREGRTVALVPTMGHLHEGHLALVRRAKALADIVVVSIFVNPMQFERTDDLDNYPRTLEEDLSKLNSEAVDLVFTPTVEVLYPNGIEQQTFVEVPRLSLILEGASRPGHFRGVATVVNKLFNIVKPDVACFGEKDYQQLAVIKKMAQDLSLNIDVVGVATVREADGLAMSSRNSRLSMSERQRAPVIARTMRWLSGKVRHGRDQLPSLIEDAQDQLRAADLDLDEIFIRDAHSLDLLSADSTQAVIMISAFLGNVRLIDNQVVDLPAENNQSEAAVREKENNEKESSKERDQDNDQEKVSHDA